MLSRIVWFICHGVWSQYAMFSDATSTVPPMDGTSPRNDFRRVDLPQPTGPTTIVNFPRGIPRVMHLSRGSDSGSHPKLPSRTLIAWRPRGGLKLSLNEFANGVVTLWDALEEWFFSVDMLDTSWRGNVPLELRRRSCVRSVGFWRRSMRTALSRNVWIRVKQPTEARNIIRNIIRDCNGSASSAKSESDVNTREKSRIAPPSLRARIAYTANVRIGLNT